MGEIRKCDYGGRLVATPYRLDQYLGWCGFAEIGPDRSQKLLAIDQQGFLHVLSTDSKLERKARLWDPRKGRPRLEFVAAADLDGDGRKEHVLLCAEEEHVAGDNPGKVMHDPTVRCYHSVSLLVLDADLCVLARYLVSSRMKNSVQAAVWAGPIAKDGGSAVLLHRLWYDRSVARPRLHSRSRGSAHG
jgi:hypothetical protein